mmetsp:Transcript_14022/g.22078  ORF Transcript_14022/g.22078 Transcript_14022/m.22078 type:complete len:409 (-) Transcript_14022:453-1679(-)
MGNDASSPESPAYPDEFTKFEGIETLGYRVLGVQPNSPAATAGLVSFLDFLVGCNGEMLMGSGEGLEEGDEYEDIDFPSLLKDNVGKELELLVHNIKSNSQRLVKITPSATWGGSGLLGVTIRLDDYGGADERLIRLLSCEHNSPAAIAGLVPMNDYLLGTTSTSFDSDQKFAEVLMVHADRIVELYVYSSESDVVRVVTLMPTLSWGGRGLLGAEVGTGYLHRFPKACRGTDGASVERKVRMGARPTEAVSALEKADTQGEGGVVVSVDEDKRLPEVAEGEGEIVNLTALTDSMSGKAMCFAEQLEMEPEPTTEGGAASNNESKQSTTEESSEQQQPSQSSGETSNAQTNGHPTINNQPPPPKRAVPPPPPPAGAKSKQPLPPPPYASPYTSSHPFQAAASADVDLR